MVRLLLKTGSLPTKQKNVTCELCGKRVSNIDQHLLTQHNSDKSVVNENCDKKIRSRRQSYVNYEELPSYDFSGSSNSDESGSSDSEFLPDDHEISEAEDEFIPEELEISDADNDFDIPDVIKTVQCKQEQIDETLLRCEICEQYFDNKNNLEWHKLTHDMEVLFECDECDKCYRYESSLENHKAHCHPKDGNKRNKKRAKKKMSSNGNTLHECDVCKKICNNLASFDRHMKEHWPFVCHLCHRKFKRKEYIVRHLRVHTGQRPFKCEKCQKTFIDKWHRYLHNKRVHEERRKYKCPYCHRMYARTDTRTKHIKKKHL